MIRLQASKFWGRIFIIPGILFIVAGAMSNTDDMVRNSVTVPFELGGLLWGLGIGFSLCTVGILINWAQRKLFSQVKFIFPLVWTKKIRFSQTPGREEKTDSKYSPLF